MKSLSSIPMFAARAAFFEAVQSTESTRQQRLPGVCQDRSLSPGGAVQPFPTRGNRESGEDQGRAWEELESPDPSMFPLNLPNSALSGVVVSPPRKEEIGRTVAFPESHSECTLVMVGWIQTRSF